MNTCSLRSLSVENKEPVIFTLDDAPVVVGDNLVALLNRKFSPMLTYDDLVIGSDVGVFLGDILEEDGELWYVLYDEGFVAYTKDKSRFKYLYEFDTFHVVGYLTKDELNSMMTQPIVCRYRYRGYILQLKDIVGTFGGDLVAPRPKGRIIVAEMQQDIFYQVDNTRFFLGDLFNGLPLLMCYGRLCIQDNNGAYSIVEEGYIKRKRGRCNEKQRN